MGVRELTSSRRYSCIVADPPWDHSDGTGVHLTVGMSSKPATNKGTRKPPYPTMSLEAIKALQVPAAPDAHLYLWTTNRYLRDVWDVAEAWGFQGVCVLTWCKEPRGFLGGGAWPSNTEFCLFARRGKLATTGKAEGRWFRLPRTFGPPTGEGGRRTRGHSAKPEAFLDLVERISPGPYLEMFARRNRLGWDTWGNESLVHVEIGEAG